MRRQLMRDLFLAQQAIVAAMAADTMRVAWTTDERFQFGGGTYGPDGPWQAISVSVGNSTGRQSGSFLGSYAALWPSGGGVSMVLTAEAGGNYTAANSSTSIDTKVSMGNSDGWMASTAQNESSMGTGFFDIVTLTDKTQTGTSQANTTLVAEKEWAYLLPDGTNYTAPVGILGLGYPMSLNVRTVRQPQSILHSLKEQGRIASATFGLHMGSVAFEQPGSLVLGGYEKNRALGPVGVFDYDPSTIPYLFLVDVLLGTQVGGSPFPDTTPGSPTSIYAGTGTNENAQRIAKGLGAKPNTAVIIPNPAVPYIYLPPGTCEAAAKVLPITFHKKTGLYLWDVNSPSYARIVRSPSYLAFVLSDRTATNITVKVPFALLNLTLEAPLADRPTAYFPCMSLDSQWGFWSLGRAFLQAAFLGVDLERNVTYLAQAPGPDMEQSVVRTVPAAGREAGMETNDLGEFEKSWEARWAVLKDDEKGGSDAVPDGGGGGGGLAVGAIVGIVVGVVVVLVVSVVMIMWFVRRKKARLATGESVLSGSVTGGGMPAAGEHAEMDGNGKIAEMETPFVVHEVPSGEVREYAELPTGDMDVIDSRREGRGEDHGLISRGH